MITWIKNRTWGELMIAAWVLIAVGAILCAFDLEAAGMAFMLPAFALFGAASSEERAGRPNSEKRKLTSS